MPDLLPNKTRHISSMKLTREMPKRYVTFTGMWVRWGIHYEILTMFRFCFFNVKTSLSLSKSASHRPSPDCLKVCLQKVHGLVETVSPCNTALQSWIMSMSPIQSHVIFSNEMKSIVYGTFWISLSLEHFDISSFLLASWNESNFVSICHKYLDISKIYSIVWWSS